MKAIDLITATRYQLNDTGKIEFSDAELLNYLNQAINYINQLGTLNEYRYLINQLDLTLNNGVADLPSDFMVEHSVVSGDYILYSVPVDAKLDNYSYKIIGNKIYANQQNITLYYYKSLPVINLDDDIPLPDIFNNLLKEIVIYMALNRVNINNSFETQLSQLFESKVLQLMNTYGNVNLERAMPF